MAGKVADLLTNRVRGLWNRLHTLTQFFREYPPGFLYFKFIAEMDVSYTTDTMDECTLTRANIFDFQHEIVF